MTDDAVLAANYLKRLLADSGAYDIPFPGVCKHEFIASASTIKRETGIRTLDIAKRLLDYGFHPPTIYFPLLVDEALMFEPTETETRESLDELAEAIEAILPPPGADHAPPSGDEPPCGGRADPRCRAGDEGGSGRHCFHFRSA